MRHSSREKDRRELGDSRRRSPEREDRSRQHRHPRERAMQQNQRSNWNRNQRRMNYPQNKFQERDKNTGQTVVKVNRNQTCPFSVKIFYSINKENPFEANTPLPQNFIFLHLWTDCSLHEIVELLRAYLPTIRTKQRFQFWRVFTQEGKSDYTKQELGTVVMHRKFDRSQDRYLQNSKFKIGDYIDVSINYK